MKKANIIVLFPYKFIHYYYFLFGFDLLEKKNFKIEMHDLSHLFISKSFLKKWKVKSYKKNNLKFKNILLWFFYIMKKKNNTIIINLTYNNFNSINSFFVKMVLSIKGFKVLTYDLNDVVIEKPKKNLNYFITKFFIEHKYDIVFYYNSIKKIIFFNLDRIIRYKREIVLTNKNNLINLKNKIFLKIHSFDYSNSLRSKDKNNKNSKYFVYLDTGFPYFSGDTFLDKSIDFSYNKFLVEKYIKNLIYFFHLIEKKFKKKVLIVFHPKFRILNSKKNFYNFFDDFLIFNKIDTNEAVRQAYCVLINTVTTSVSFAVLNYKPIIFLNSQLSRSFIGINEIIERKKLLSLLSVKSLNIDQVNSIEKRHFKIDKKAYDNYKYKYLQNLDPNLKNKFNSEIIYNAIKGNSNL